MRVRRGERRRSNAVKNGSVLPRFRERRREVEFEQPRGTRGTPPGDDFVARTARLDDPLFQLYRPLTSRAPLDEQPERTEHAAPGDERERRPVVEMRR